ncbi:MAG: hypothetical protein LBE84_09840 [Planctomycetota bacterium]|jgi:hypothetical protein|nr:hypothetical protein [Planctomycetota bacterium]
MVFKKFDEFRAERPAIGCFLQDAVLFMNRLAGKEQPEAFPGLGCRDVFDIPPLDQGPVFKQAIQKKILAILFRRRAVKIDQNRPRPRSPTRTTGKPARSLLNAASAIWTD